MKTKRPARSFTCAACKGGFAHELRCRDFTRANPEERVCPGCLQATHVRLAREVDDLAGEPAEKRRIRQADIEGATTLVAEVEAEAAERRAAEQKARKVSRRKGGRS